MHEAHAQGESAVDATVTGFSGSARVVTAAAVIMFSVFASFLTSEDTVIKSIAFGLAFGVLFDAFLVRMTLIPAVHTLLGDRGWWLPRWVARILPDLDIEGERLARRPR
jgi:RND superfamily putative drug exporter